jgi:hypothetical protein
MPETQWLKTVVKLSLMSKMLECVQPIAETFIKYANFVHTILWDKDNYPSTLLSAMQEQRCSLEDMRDLSTSE